jgi:hypothetical protein
MTEQEIAFLTKHHEVTLPADYEFEYLDVANDKEMQAVAQFL